MFRPGFIALLLLLASLNALADAQLEINAGDFDRKNPVIEFSGHGGQLIGPNGKALPVQQLESGKAVFILPNLGKGESVRFKYQKSGPRTGAKVSAKEENGKVTFSSGGKELLVYQGKESELPRADIRPEYKRGGYIHPVYTPSGRVITDDYPKNHIHHHGIWFPWTKTELEGRHPDFWNMGDKKGKVEFVKLFGEWAGPAEAGLKAEHRFIDLTAEQPKAALNEQWILQSYGILEGKVPANVFDLVSMQTCATESPLKLPKYYYGGLGFRGRFEWNGKDKTFFMLSETETNRVKQNEMKARWAYIGGMVDAKQSGVAILCHPENFRFPQPVRVHPTEPFFCYAPSQEGDWEITPGKPYVSKYRFVAFDGEPDRAEIERMWNDYAHPPGTQRWTVD